MMTEPNFPPAKVIYGVFGLVFGICFPIIVLIQNFPVSLLTDQKAQAQLKGYVIVFVVYLVWLAWSAAIGALTGMLIGALSARITKNRKINQLVMSGIGGLIWSIVMSVLALVIPMLLSIVFFSVLGRNPFLAVILMAFGAFALFGGIILIIPFSVIGFSGSAAIAGQAAKRFAPKAFHFFLAAGAVGAIFCLIALFLKVIANIIRI